MLQACRGNAIRPLGITLGDPDLSLGSAGSADVDDFGPRDGVEQFGLGGAGARNTALTLTVRALSSVQARRAWAWSGVRTLTTPRRSGVRAASKDSMTRTVTTGPRVSPQCTSASSGAPARRRRIEEARARQRRAARDQLGAGVDGVLDLAVHPHALVGVDHRAELGPRVHPGPILSARARRVSASRKARRARGARRRARPNRRTGRRPRTRWPQPRRRPRPGRRPRRRSPDGCRPPPPGADHEVHRGVHGQRAGGALVAVQQLQDAAEIEQLDHPLGRQRRLLGRLEHDRVAGDQRRREHAAARGERVAPGHQDRDHAARLAEHEVAACPRDRGRPGRARRRPRRRRSRPRRRRVTRAAASRPRASAARPARARARAAGGRRPSAASRAPRAGCAPTGPARRVRRPPSGSPRGRRRPGCGRWLRRWRDRGRRAPVPG